MVLSHPSWVCGLKPNIENIFVYTSGVTPFVGVWIETKDCIMEMTDAKGHTLRGCVD